MDMGNGYFKNVEDENVKKGVRAYELNEGDIFTIKELTVQYEDKGFHEVKFCGYDKYMQSIWTKTGKVYIADELNEYCK